MPNKSSKNGSERFWPTAQARDYRSVTGREHLQRENAMQNLNVAEVYSQHSTPTSSPSTEPTTPGLICSQVDFLANLSVSPGSEEARQMTVRSGLKCCELLTAQSPVGSLVKTLLESSRWNSTISFLTWKPSATPRGRLLFRLVPSMPDTEETGCGLWHTPTTCDTSPSYEKRYPGGKTRPSPIPNLAAEVNEGVPYSVRCRQDKVKMWPTQTSHLAKETNAPSEANRNEPTISSIVGGSLNPQFVEWLMGYPKEWTVAENFASGRKKICKPQESAPESNIAPTDCVG